MFKLAVEQRQLMQCMWKVRYGLSDSPVSLASVHDLVIIVVLHVVLQDLLEPAAWEGWGGGGGGGGGVK